MMADARFEDVDERPLRLRAESPQDLVVISALVQDAVTEGTRAAWMPRRRRFSLMLNRFRWETAERCRRDGRPFERVQSLLCIDQALKVRAHGIDPRNRDVVLCVLAVAFEPGPDGAGTVTITLAGDGAFAVDVECLEVSLTDVTQPYLARASAPPAHAD
jgi:hypothetical protein